MPPIHNDTLDLDMFFLALQNSKLSVKWGLYFIPFTGFNGICALDVICKLLLIRKDNYICIFVKCLSKNIL